MSHVTRYEGGGLDLKCEERTTPGKAQGLNNVSYRSYRSSTVDLVSVDMN